MVLSAREQILEKARNVVRGYAASKGHWNPASSLTALLRQMQREYEDRFLYELIQNAYDAHAADAEGEIAILLDEREGEHGVLYVANGGEPFGTENFEAICELAQSNKAPDQSIGNKGVGFKSVLQVCTWPEIYSRTAPGSSCRRVRRARAASPSAVPGQCRWIAGVPARRTTERSTRLTMIASSA
jgi:hypothetical protein